MAWNDLCKFREELDPTKRLHFATKFYYDFLNGKDSPMELNVSTTAAKDIKDSLDLGKAPDALFNTISQEISVNLADTFSRFQFSFGYMKVKNDRKFVDGALNLPLLAQQEI